MQDVLFRKHLIIYIKENFRMKKSKSNEMLNVFLSELNDKEFLSNTDYDFGEIINFSADNNKKINNLNVKILDNNE